MPTAFFASLRGGGSAESALSVAGFLISGCVLPTLLTVALIRSGKLRTIDLQHRDDRLIPSLVSALGCTLACSALYRAGAPQSISESALGISIQMLLLAVVTLRWKISYHAASASALVAMSHSVGNLGLTLALVLLALSIGWARIYQRRHTPAQVAVGALTAVPLAILTWL